MLKKYQATVLSMHKKLKELAEKFEAGEKHKNQKLRKARKQMEAELHRLKGMNEKLFRSSTHLEKKLETCIEENRVLVLANQEFLRARETQANQIKKLISINHCQDTMIENLRTRLDYLQLLENREKQSSELTTLQKKVFQSKRSRSTSVKFKKGLTKKFDTDNADETEGSKEGDENLTAAVSLASEEEGEMEAGEPSEIQKNHNESQMQKFEQNR